MPSLSPLPALNLCGPDTTLRGRVAAQLRILGYGADEAPRRAAASGSEPDATIAVVYLGSCDSGGLETLHAILEQDKAPVRTAYVFVLPGAMGRLRSALEAVRGHQYFALVDNSARPEALERQLALAARWLEVMPSSRVLSAPEAPPALSLA